MGGGGEGGRREWEEIWEGLEGAEMAEGKGTGRGVKELSPEVGREGNVWGEEMAPSLQSCCSMCAVNC